MQRGSRLRLLSLLAAMLLALGETPAVARPMQWVSSWADGLHPNAAGYRLIGEAVPLSLFRGAR